MVHHSIALILIMETHDCQHLIFGIQTGLPPVTSLSQQPKSWLDPTISFQTRVRDAKSRLLSFCKGAPSVGNPETYTSSLFAGKSVSHRHGYPMMSAASRRDCIGKPIWLVVRASNQNLGNLLGDLGPLTLRLMYLTQLM